MNDDKRQLQEITQHEQWLARALPADASQSTENLKLRVRVELGEQWLRSEWNDCAEPVSRELRQAVRIAIRGSSPREMVHEGRNSMKTWRLISGAALGLAAMLFLSVSIFKTDQAEPLISDDEVIAFEDTADVEEFDDKLDEALAELDDLLASRDETDWEDVLEGL